MRRIGLVAAVTMLLLAAPLHVRAQTAGGELLQVSGHSIVHLDVRSGEASWLYSKWGRAITSVDWSPDGRYVVFTEGPCSRHFYGCTTARWHIKVLRMEDRRVRTVKTVTALWVNEVSWAPRGGHIAYQSFTAAVPTWPPVIVNEVHAVHATRATHHFIGTGYGLAWHPSGERITYTAPLGLLTSDLRGVPRRVTSAEYVGFWPAWSPDGTRVAFVGGSRLGGNDLFVVNADRRPRSFGATGHDKPSWSPDGRFLAASSGNGIDVVDVRTGNRRALGSEGYGPAWSPSGTMIAAVKAGFVRILDADTGRELAMHHTGATDPPRWRPMH